MLCVVASVLIVGWQDIDRYDQSEKYFFLIS